MVAIIVAGGILLIVGAVAALASSDALTALASPVVAGTAA